jgi:hypothetical protein
MVPVGRQPAGGMAALVFSTTFEHVKEAIRTGSKYVSIHAGEEAMRDDVPLDDIEAATQVAECIEDYPDDPRGASCLLLCEIDGKPVHALWGFDDQRLRAILITVYRPDPGRWSNDFRKRRSGSAG